MSARRRRRTPVVATFACLNCGADVRVGSLACRECGSDAETGWSEDTLYDGLDLPPTGTELEADARHRARAGRRPPWGWVLFGLLLAALLGVPTCF